MEGFRPLLMTSMTMMKNEIEPLHSQSSSRFPSRILLNSNTNSKSLQIEEETETNFYDSKIDLYFVPVAAAGCLGLNLDLTNGNTYFIVSRPYISSLFCHLLHHNTADHFLPYLIHRPIIFITSRR